MNSQDNTADSPTEKETITELIKTIQRLEAEKELLEIMVLQQRNFIAKVAHEARSHVRFMSFGFERLFKVNYTPEMEAEYGRMIYLIMHSSQKYHNLLQNLTEHSLSEYGRKIIVKLETVPLNDYIDNIIKEYTSFVAELGYPLQLLLAVHPFEALLDTIKFRQVVHNLIINATQHGEKGTINVAIHADPFEKTWNLAIINPFLPYSQTESYRNGHLGLGLPICKELIEHMGGKLDTNREGQLFTATIRMPLVSMQVAAALEKIPAH